MSGYEYDDTGQYYFFVLGITLVALLPWTWFEANKARHSAARIKPPCRGWNAKDESIVRTRKTVPRFKKSTVALAVGWAFLAFTTYRASLVKLQGSIYDPFAILGISSSLEEKAIKRHYKRLTLKFHPDKLKLTGNQTKEQVDAHFVELTKAYKSLTDETIRRNYELYGHPDGKQDFGMGIAIPKALIAAENNAYVLGVYALIFGVALPYFVGKWWFGSRRVTKDGVLNTTAATLYLNMKEDMAFAQAVECVSAASEIEQYLSKRNITGSEYDRLQNQVKEQLKVVAGDKMEGRLYSNKPTQKAGILIYAHLLRVPINGATLLQDQQHVVKLAYKASLAFGNIVLAHSWLTAYNNVVTLQQALAQASHPALPGILQLPHVSTSTAKSSSCKSIEAFVQASDEKRRRELADLSDKEFQEAVAVAEHWPKLELVHAAFKVIGERVVTPGAIVQLIVKVKITPPKRNAAQPNGIPTPEDGSGIVTPAEPVLADEQEIDELIGRKFHGQDGEESNGFAHTPRLPFDKVPSWYLYIGDQKLDRVFVPPTKFGEIGESKTRTLRVTHQAPPGPGLYTFQLFLRSDCYLGTDIKKNMQMNVEAEAPQRTDEEDDISDPEEDTIAGQMAAMRGQHVKRIPDEDDEDTSGTDEYDSDDAGGNTTSDEE